MKLNMDGPDDLEEAHAGRAALLARLAADGYDFATPTASTVRRWLARPAPERLDAREILGWGRPFHRYAIDPSLLDALDRASALVAEDGLWKSRLRAAVVHGQVFLHSAFPGAGDQAVFVGPDSYRFADLVRARIGDAPVRSILDIGTGAGVGAILAATLAPGARVHATDVNPAALALARANAEQAGVAVDLRLADGLSGAPDGLDLILANPPYVAGQSGRTYKDGGGDLGERLALDWAAASVEHLEIGGRFILYTGAPILAGGRDVVREGLAALCSRAGLALDYASIDPDIFPGELRRPAYAEVERIAAVGAVVTRTS